MTTLIKYDFFYLPFFSYIKFHTKYSTVRILRAHIFCTIAYCKVLNIDDLIQVKYTYTYSKEIEYGAIVVKS